MDLIDAFIVLSSNRNLLLTILFLLITAFGLFFATHSLPFRKRNRVAVFLGMASLVLLLLAVLLLMNTLGTREKPEEGTGEQLESIDFPELQEEMRRSRTANRSSSE